MQPTLVKQLSELTVQEKAELLQELARDLGGDTPGVESNPEVCGGDACIVRTRIPVWILEGYRRGGLSDAEILDSYPTLRAEDLVNAWAYAGRHRDEIDRAIRENEELE